MPLRQQSPEGFVGFVRVVGHGIEHQERGGICRLVVVDDHLDALFVHTSLPLFTLRGACLGAARYGSVRSRASAQPAGERPPLAKAPTRCLTLCSLALGHRTSAFSAVPTVPQSGYTPSQAGRRWRTV